MKSGPAPMVERKRCREAANMMLLLCLMNVGPVMLLTAMGMAGAAMTNPDRPFNSVRAMLTGLLVLGLPFVVAQVWVRQGRWGAILFGLVLELLLLGFLVFLVVGVVDALFTVQFKVLAGALAVVTMGAYALGVFRLLGALREARAQRTGLTNTRGA